MGFFIFTLAVCLSLEVGSQCLWTGSMAIHILLGITITSELFLGRVNHRRSDKNISAYLSMLIL